MLIINMNIHLRTDANKSKFVMFLNHTGDLRSIFSIFINNLLQVTSWLKVYLLIAVFSLGFGFFEQQNQSKVGIETNQDVFIC